jgi:hypothetical protein
VSKWIVYEAGKSDTPLAAHRRRSFRFSQGKTLAIAVVGISEVPAAYQAHHSVDTFRGLKIAVYTTDVYRSAGWAFAILAAGHMCRALRIITFSNDGDGCRAVRGGNLNPDVVVDNVLPLLIGRLAILLRLLCSWAGHSSSLALRLCARSASSVRLRGNRLQGTRASLLRLVQNGQIGIGICP